MSGDRAALEVALAAAGEPEELEEAEQLDLLRQPETIEGEMKMRAVERRGPGRPPGARNKRTERTIAWLLSHHRDPREVLLSISDKHPADLAAVLGCSMLEALQEIRIAAGAVLPYVAQRQPLGIDVTNRQVVYLTINEGGQATHQEGGVGLSASIVENVEFQEVSEDDPKKV